MEALKMNNWNHHSASREIGMSRSAKRQDEAQLARLGKREVLTRNFGFMAVLGFSATILMTWEGILSGGPAGTVYGYFFVWTGLAATYSMLSEMASMAPTTGGQYHWCSMLAPKSTSKFSSYVTGWLTVVGWQASYAATCYISGVMIQGIIILMHPDYIPHAWHTTLLSWAIVAFSVMINVVGGSLLPRFEGLILVIHVLGFFAVLIPLVYMADHNSAQYVFTTWQNSGEWPTQTLSTFVGMIGTVFSFAGGDAAVHMAEETKNPQKLIPVSLMSSLLINGILGFAMLLATLFCIGDLQAAIHTPTGFPFIEIFYQVTKSRGSACAMSSIMVFLPICAMTGVLATASRQFWAFSRDRGVPGWRIWSRVSESTNIPVNSVWLTAVISMLLGLIPLGSSVAFNDLTSMSTSGLYLSYIVCCILLLWRRCTGGIMEMNDYRSRNSSGVVSEADEDIINTAGAKIVWGPFHLKGIFGIVANIVAIAYLLIVTFFSFFPPTAKITASTMNYSACGTVGVMLLSILYYVLRARKVFEGPIIEL
ncbi:amino acid transporter, putative [Talaromyces stipitatus ATCC 10500]|uniref:Amino acid transporter, putative n=1 Tax=Talaromyces stipitatus (strain ATCC 10500 / CBS 375.48 / QM 6759 / NRRL 1006) TaxID=441959 RepID=B8MHT2_TALSN|nr:amino acid transporter, putative [Talaromyces stipitatus ATCC 10500]EED16412.1 amino acid transporter, putative [Talaromyces stipitatus ATCC 10500]